MKQTIATSQASRYGYCPNNKDVPDIPVRTHLYHWLHTKLGRAYVNSQGTKPDRASLTAKGGASNNLDKTPDTYNHLLEREVNAGYRDGTNFKRHLLLTAHHNTASGLVPLSQKQTALVTMPLENIL